MLFIYLSFACHLTSTPNPARPHAWKHQCLLFGLTKPRSPARYPCDLLETSATHPLWTSENNSPWFRSVPPVLACFRPGNLSIRWSDLQSVSIPTCQSGFYNARLHDFGNAWCIASWGKAETENTKVQQPQQTGALKKGWQTDIKPSLKPGKPAESSSAIAYGSL